MVEMVELVEGVELVEMVELVELVEGVELVEAVVCEWLSTCCHSGERRNPRVGCGCECGCGCGRRSGFMEIHQETTE